MKPALSIVFFTVSAGAGLGLFALIVAGGPARAASLAGARAVARRVARACARRRGIAVVDAAPRESEERVALVLAFSHVVAVARGGVRGRVLSGRARLYCARLRWNRRKLARVSRVPFVTPGVGGALLHGDDLRESQADPAMAHGLDAGELRAARSLVGRGAAAAAWSGSTAALPAAGRCRCLPSASSRWPPSSATGSRCATPPLRRRWSARSACARACARRARPSRRHVCSIPGTRTGRFSPTNSASRLRAGTRPRCASPRWRSALSCRWAGSCSATRMRWCALATAVFCIIGVLAERWLFFAEARHTVRLYHGDPRT